MNRWQPPERPKIYHIVHCDKIPHIVAEGQLCSDAILSTRVPVGTVIGMNSIKQRRQSELQFSSHPGLFVGQCVPFYFCPRSVMLYLLYQANHPELTYRAGQGQIVHLEADLHATVEWAVANNLRWAFTLSNAGARYFEDRADLSQLNEINWDAVLTNRWSGAGISPDIKHGKQAEFLVERNFPWSLVERIGVHSRPVAQSVLNSLDDYPRKPIVEIRTDWYY